MDEEDQAKENGNKNVGLLQDVGGMSMEEFKSKFFAWYENTGLVTEMRAHLRHQMIAKLQNTILGQTISNECGQSSVSPKIQVLHLLIAEFLHHHRLFYTLSIFVTEVPHLNVYSEFVNAIKTSSNNQYETTEPPKPSTALQPKDILDVLDVFEIQQTRDRQQIVDAYSKDNHESLLSIIINHLTHIEIEEILIDNSNNLLNKSLPDLDSFRWNMGIHNLLIKAKIKGSLLHILKDNIFRYYQKEIIRIRAEEKAKHKQQLTEKLNEITKGEINEYMKQRDEFQSKYLKYKKALEFELRQKKKLVLTINNLNAEFERVSQDIAKLECQAPENQRFEHKLREEISEKDAEIEQLKLELNTKTICLNERERFTNEIHEMLEKTQFNYGKKIEEYLETITELQSKNLMVQCQLDEMKQQNQTLIAQVEKNAAIKQMYNHVNDENEQLRAQLNDVRFRSEQLNQEFQTRITSFPSIAVTEDDEELRQLFYTPPSTDVPLAPLTGRFENRQMGGGEESTHSELNPPTIYRQVTHTLADRKTPRRLLIAPVESSPTDDVLEEARRRLRRLEEESQTVEQNYEQFRNHQPRFVDLFRFANETLCNVPTTSNQQPNINDILQKMYDIQANNYEELKNKTQLLTSSTTWSDQLPQCYVSKSDENVNLPKTPSAEVPVVKSPTSLPYVVRSNHPMLPKEKLNDFLKQVKSSFQHLDETAMEISQTLTNLSVNSNQLTQEINNLPSDKEMNIEDKICDERDEEVRQVDEEESPPVKSTGAIKKTYATEVEPEKDENSMNKCEIKMSNRFYFDPKADSTSNLTNASKSNDSTILTKLDQTLVNQGRQLVNSLNNIEESTELSENNSTSSVQFFNTLNNEESTELSKNNSTLSVPSDTNTIQTNVTTPSVYSQHEDAIDVTLQQKEIPKQTSETSLISPQKKILAEIEKTLIESERFLNDEKNSKQRNSNDEQFEESLSLNSNDSDDISAGIDDISNTEDNFWN